MKKTILVIAVSLGISVVGFSQMENVNPLNAQYQEALVIDEVTGKQMDMVIENQNVTVVAGETIIIHTDGISKVIALKENGEFIGEIRIGSWETEDFSTRFKRAKFIHPKG